MAGVLSGTRSSESLFLAVIIRATADLNDSGKLSSCVCDGASCARACIRFSKPLDVADMLSSCVGVGGCDLCPFVARPSFMRRKGDSQDDGQLSSCVCDDAALCTGLQSNCTSGHKSWVCDDGTSDEWLSASATRLGKRMGSGGYISGMSWV